MARFWDLMERSVIIQGIVTLAFVITICVLVAMSRVVPQEMWVALGLVLGFWFGSKVQTEEHAAARKRTAEGNE
jgi:hypothetical protein